MTTEATLRQRADLFLEAYGSTRVAALRQIYGNAFASGIDGREMLSEVAELLDPREMDKLVRDHAIDLSGLQSSRSQ